MFVTYLSDLSIYQFLPSKAAPLEVSSYAEYLTTLYKRTEEAGPKEAGPKEAGPKEAEPKGAGPKEAGPKEAGGQWPPIKFQCYTNLFSAEKMEDLPRERGDYCTLIMMHSEIEEFKNVRKAIADYGQVGTMHRHPAYTYLRHYGDVHISFDISKHKAFSIVGRHDRRW